MLILSELQEKVKSAAVNGNIDVSFLQTFSVWLYYDHCRRNWGKTAYRTGNAEPYPSVWTRSGQASKQTYKQAYRKTFIKDFCAPAPYKDVISCCSLWIFKHTFDQYTEIISPSIQDSVNADVCAVNMIKAQIVARDKKTIARIHIGNGVERRAFTE